MGPTAGLDAIKEKFLGSTGNLIPVVQPAPVAIRAYFLWLKRQEIKCRMHSFRMLKHVAIHLAFGELMSF
jgi:hypothetical protein